MMLYTSEQLLHTWEIICLLSPTAGAAPASAVSSGVFTYLCYDLAPLLPCLVPLCQPLPPPIFGSTEDGTRQEPLS